MNSKRRHNRLSLARRLLAIAFITLLPLLAVGGSVKAAASLPPTITPNSPAQYSTLVMRVYFNSLAERDALARELAAEEVPTTGGYLTVLGDTAMYNNLVSRHLRVEVDDRLSRQLSDPQLFHDTFYGGYKTVEEIYTFLDQEAAAHPTLAVKEDIGDSWCKTHPGSCVYPSPHNGYDLFVMHITNQAIPGPKPVFWADGAIHAREIATPEVAMRFISWLLDQYDTDPDARWLVDYHDIWIMPTFNPDGHHIVEAGGGGASPYYYRKNGNNTLGQCAEPPTPFDHFGVDDNRNFPFKWGCCGGSTTDPCAQTYRGVAENSEDETAAVTAKLLSLYPDQRGPGDGDPAPITTTGVYQNIHTVANINLYPWGWTGNAMPNFNETDNIAKHISSPQAQGNDYAYGSIYGQLYPVDGGSIDWTYGQLGIASISTELGGGDFLPAYTCIDNPGCGSPTGLWPENKGMLTYLAKIARTPYLTSHGPDANLVATNPLTVTLGSTSQLTGTINFAWNGSDGSPNSFRQNVGAAEYYIDTPPWAGGTAIPMQPVDGHFNSFTEAAQATIDTTGLPLGRHIVLVRGRGQTDFAGFQTWGPISAAFLDVVPGGVGTPTPVASTPTATSTTLPPSTGTPTPITPSATSTTAPQTPTITLTSPPATSTATACAINFSDVPPGSTFYTWINCLACQGIINGYPDGTFRPNNNVTRGQLSKIVSNSAGFNDPQTTQMFQDVPPGSTFFDFIGRLASRGYINGYPCGFPGEPCNPPSNLPYFRPNTGATRGQIAKIDSNAAGYTDPPDQQLFEDVVPTTPFYDYVQRLGIRGTVAGYPCGSPGEPCIPPDNRPYYRPSNKATRGETSKIDSNTFFPNCDLPARR
jgi:hypothetical protein